MGDGEGNFNGLDEGLCCIHFCVRTQSLSRVQFFVTPLAIAHQASLPMEFSRQEYWSGLPFPSPGDLANPGSHPRVLHLLPWQAGSLPLCHLLR